MASINLICYSLLGNKREAMYINVSLLLKNENKQKIKNK